MELDTPDIEALTTELITTIEEGDIIEPGNSAEAPRIGF